MECLASLSALIWLLSVWIPRLCCFGLPYTLRLFETWLYPPCGIMESDSIIMADVFWNDFRLNAPPTDRMLPLRCPVSYLTHILYILDCTPCLTSCIVTAHHYVFACTWKLVQKICTLNMAICFHLTPSNTCNQGCRRCSHTAQGT